MAPEGPEWAFEEGLEFREAQDQGPTGNSMAPDRLVVWLLVLKGSRNQSWAWTTAPGPGF